MVPIPQFAPIPSANRIVGWALLVSLAVLSACSSVGGRKQQRPDAYQNLSHADKALVDQGKIQPGMDTNAVYIALGPPSEVANEPASPTPQTVWIYYGNRPVQVPNWTFLPTNRGYSSLEFTPDHYSVAYTKAEVFFQNGRVVRYERF